MTYRVLHAIHAMSWMRVCTVGVDLVNGLSSARVPEYVDDDDFSDGISVIEHVTELQLLCMREATVQSL